MEIGVCAGHFQEAPDLARQLEILQGFPTVRFMDWAMVNRFWDSPPSPETFDALPHGGGWEYTGGKWHDWKGVPIEVIIDTANRVGARPWVCLHHSIRADNEIWRWVDTVLRNAKHRPIIEWSNEVWNWSFVQTKEIGKNDWERMANHAETLAKISKMVGERADIVLCEQAANSWRTGWMLDNTQVKEHITAIACAPYFRNQQELEAVPKTMAPWTGLAQKHGLRLWCYEGGQHDETPLAHLWNDTPAMGAAYSRYTSFLEQAQVERVMLYNAASLYRPGYAWGLTAIEGGVLRKTYKYWAVRK